MKNMGLDTQQFILKAKEIHGDKYDYSKTLYTKYNDKVCIVCPKHGEFMQIAGEHLKGHGCRKCGAEFRGKNKSLGKDKFIEKANKIHNGKYDYSKVEYVNSNTKVTIICPIHGEFEQIPINHLHGSGCPKCKSVRIGDLKRNSIDEFIRKSRLVHGDKYDYSKVFFRRSDEKVCIICPEHGEFWQTANSHMSGHGCQLCIGNTKSNTEEFIRKSRLVHGDKYDYSKVKYVNNTTNVILICPEHGEFEQTPKNHLKGQGCNKCAISYRAKLCSLTTESFIEKSRLVHGDKYDYSKTVYRNYNTSVVIICPKHGEFMQTPSEHLSGCGCPKCGMVISKAEEEITNYIENEIGIKCNKRVRNIIKPYELDIVVPSKQLAIEYDGLIWHSEKFNHNNFKHLYKTQKCKELGIELLHVFEDEWIEKPTIIKNILKRKTGKYSMVVNSEKCIIRETTKEETEAFFNENNIDGFYKTKYNYGLFMEDTLVSCISLKQTRPKIFQIKRFCDKSCMYINGSLNKLLTYVSSLNEVEKFTYKDDMRMSMKSIFVECGFETVKIEKPDYYYVKGIKRYKRYSFDKNRVKEQGKTLHQSMNENSYYRLYDCGREVLEANANIFIK